MKTKKNNNYLKVIDYLLLLKLIMYNKGYDFPNNFYTNWVNYLLPYIKTNNNYEYSDNDNFKSIVCKYNINHNIFDISKNIDIYNNIEFIKNLNIDINLHNKYNYDNIKILRCDIKFFKKKLFYRSILLSFSFDIPKCDLYLIKKNIWDYEKFNKYLEEKWVLSHSLDNDDYIYSDKYKKILYFEIFNKIILRIIKYN